MKRNASIELLRIISMLMIITMHFFGHGGVSAQFTGVSGVQIISELICGVSRVAVNCYILISGYYLCESEFRWSKVVRLWTQVLLYSAVIFLALLLTGKIRFAGKDAVYAFFPVSTNSDAFSTEYIMMYLLSPFLNKMIHAMDRKQFRNLLITLAVFFVLLPNLFCFMGTTIEFGGGYGIVWFVVLYLTGAYIRKWGPDISLKKRVWIYLAAGSLVPLSSIFASLAYLATGIKKLWDFKELFYPYCSVLVYPASIAFFGLFLKLEIKKEWKRSLISFFAPTTFGIYLIHDNRFLRKVLWSVLAPGRYAASYTLFLYWIVCVLSIFLLCAMIDKVRGACFKRLYRTETLSRIDRRRDEGV